MGLGVTIGATVQVCCVHDRPKREIVELEFDPHQHKVHLCACCENLFLERTDEPRFCDRCTGPLRHALGGALPDPTGVVG